MISRSFRERYCQSRKISEDQFQDTLLLEACYPKSRFLYRIGMKTRSLQCDPERDLLISVGMSDDVEKVETMINGALFARYLKDLNPIRHWLKFRISGSRLVRIARLCFNTP